MAAKLRWGVLSTGNIARQFCAGVIASDRGELTAVASRQLQSAADFAAAYHVDRSYGDYAALLNDPHVDAIYNALPNSMHHEWTIKALRAGKHVLCEKPIAASAAQAQEMFDVSQKAGRLLVEAFMYRSHPLTRRISETLRSGTIGQLRMIRSSFCYCTTKTSGNIRFRKELAGGALMDIGCYCLNFTRFFAGGEPTSFNVVGHLFETGVDDYAAGTLQFANGIVATFTCGMTLQADNTTSLCGTDGFIEIPIPWKPPVAGAAFTIAHSTPPKMDSPQSLAPPKPPRQSFAVDAGKELYALEADDFAASVLDGAPPVIPPSDSLGNMRLLDAMRRQLGVEVPD